MTSRFKDFGAGVAEADKRPLSFKLHGEEFHCKPAIQGKAMLEMVASSESDNNAEMANVITTFFNVALAEESKEPFFALLEDPDKIVTVETLSEIIAWLVEEYTGRPTQQPEPSSSGQ